MLAVLLVAVFLDNVDREDSPAATRSRMQLEGRSSEEDKMEVRSEEEEVRNIQKSFCSTFLATFRQLGDWRQVLLIPVTSYIGLHLGFLNGEYTKVSVFMHMKDYRGCMLEFSCQPATA